MQQGKMVSVLSKTYSLGSLTKWQKDAVNKDGMYMDVNVIEISKDPEPKKKINPTADIKHFFSDSFIIDGHKKRQRCCNLCGR